MKIWSMIICLEYSAKISGTYLTSKKWYIEYSGMFKIFLGHTKLPSIWDVEINNFQYVFHKTEEKGISVYGVFTLYLYKKYDYLIITNDFRDGKNAIKIHYRYIN